jgi:hypothetical protein
MDDVQDPFAPLSDSERTASEPKGERKDGDAGQVVAPVPANAPEPPMSCLGLGPATGRWTYHSVEGQTLFHVARFDPPGERKEIRPLTLWRDVSRSNGLKWRWKAFPKPRPLYGLHLLAGRLEAPVMICEGEKTADAAKRVFPDFVATTSPGGALAVREANWTPLTGRIVVIWPDHDEAGAKYALEVAAILRNVCSTIRIINVAKLIGLDGGQRNSIRSS